MFSRRSLCLILLAAASLVTTLSSDASAAYRQRYASWSYHTTRSYYYRQYYYKPYTSYSGYDYHYCIHYPSQPRYVYYYNPVSRVYWGRYDLESKGYSMLEEKDRKADLKEIPESAFPEPGEMPSIPGAEDDVKIERPDPNDLPTGETPKDVPDDANAPQ
jgi:hypothetical protein